MKSIQNFISILHIFWIFCNPLFLSFFQITDSYPLGRNKHWVFWYYSNNGRNKNCGNYCIITVSIIATLIFILIICGFWSCYRIKINAKKGESTYNLN